MQASSELQVTAAWQEPTTLLPQLMLQAPSLAQLIWPLSWELVETVPLQVLSAAQLTLQVPSSESQATLPPQAPTSLQAIVQLPASSTVLHCVLPSQLSLPQVTLQSRVSPLATPQATLALQLLSSHFRLQVSAMQLTSALHELVPVQLTVH